MALKYVTNKVPYRIDFRRLSQMVAASTRRLGSDPKARVWTRRARQAVETRDKGIFVLRAALGAGFLFAGLDKFLMLASKTPFTATGFLKFATSGAWLSSDPKAIVNPTHGFWVSLAGNTGIMSIVDTLVVFGECAIGVALILGLATRFAGLAGAVMMALFYVANWSFATGPFNEQFMYGVIAGSIAILGAGAYALDSVVISRLPAVGRIPVLRNALG